MKKPLRIIIPAVLIAGLVFCLWYTRPRTLDSILGLEGREVTHLSAVCISVADHNEGSVGYYADHESYLLDSAEDETAGELLDIMGSTRYRCSLLSLLPSDGVTYYNVDATAHISMVLDGSDTCTAVYMGAVHFGSLITNPVDESVNERLMEFIQTHGTKN